MEEVTSNLGSEGRQQLSGKLTIERSINLQPVYTKGSANHMLVKVGGMVSKDPLTTTKKQFWVKREHWSSHRQYFTTSNHYSKECLIEPCIKN